MTEVLSAGGVQALPLPSPLPFPWEGQAGASAGRPASEHVPGVTTSAGHRSVAVCVDHSKSTASLCAAAENFVGQVLGNVDPDKWGWEEQCSKGQQE